MVICALSYNHIMIRSAAANPRRQYSSVLILVLMNLIPAYGVIFDGWDAFDVVFIYVAETVVIGLLNIFKRAFANSLEAGSQPKFPIMLLALKFFMIPFFILHYFFFIMVQAVFLFAFLKGHGIENLLEIPLAFWQTLSANNFEIGLTVMSIFGSHLYSFLFNYIGNKEYEKIGLPILMFQPYIRIFIQQFVVIVGIILMTIFNTPTVFVLLLVFLKIIADATMHIKIHQKYSGA